MLCSEQVFSGMLELPKVIDDGSQPDYKNKDAPGRVTLPRVGGKGIGPKDFCNGNGPD